MKSMCQEPRRNSPSVATVRPTSSCIRTASRIASSSRARSSATSIVPCAYSSRARFSSGGRSRLPTCSARAGVDLAVTHFERLGCETRIVEGVEAGQGRAVRVLDPLGFTIEFFHEMSRTERLLQRFDLQRGAQPMRIDHLNIQVPDVQRAFDHWTSLGFLLTEYIAEDDEEDTLVAAW